MVCNPGFYPPTPQEEAESRRKEAERKLAAEIAEAAQRKFLAEQFVDHLGGSLLVAYDTYQPYGRNKFACKVRRESAKLGPDAIESLKRWCEDQWGPPGRWSGLWRYGDIRECWYFRSDQHRFLFKINWHQTMPSTLKNLTGKRG